MTSKAGQKCTAIRRALVPTASVDAVIDAVRERIAERVVVGDPSAEGVTIGPLASTGQRDDVLAQGREGCRPPAARWSSGRRAPPR